MKKRIALLLLMLAGNTLMIMGTQVEQYLKDLKHRPIRTTEKDDFPDLLFFASGFYQ